MLPRWQWGTWTQRRPLSRFMFLTHSFANPITTSAQLENLQSLFGILQASLRYVRLQKDQLTIMVKMVMMMMLQALLAPPLYLGRVAKRLKGPNSAKVTRPHPGLSILTIISSSKPATVTATLSPSSLTNIKEAGMQTAGTSQSDDSVAC